MPSDFITDLIDHKERVADSAYLSVAKYVLEGEPSMDESIAIRLYKYLTSEEEYSEEQNLVMDSESFMGKIQKLLAYLDHDAVDAALTIVEDNVESIDKPSLELKFTVPQEFDAVRIEAGMLWVKSKIDEEKYPYGDPVGKGTYNLLQIIHERYMHAIGSPEWAIPSLE